MADNVLQFVDQEQPVIDSQKEIEAVADLDRRLKDMTNARQEWDVSRKAIIDLLFPMREIGFADSENSGVSGVSERGAKVGSGIYDGTGIDALQTYADGIQGNLISRAWQWFGLKMTDRELNEIYEVKLWLSDLAPALYNEFRSSTFYDVTNPFLMDLGSCGTAYMYIEDMMTAEVRQEKIQCTSLHWFECYISENAWGQVDTLFRKYQMQYRQIGQKFKEANFSETVQNKIEKTPDEYADICHAVFPRDKWIDDVMVSRFDKRFASVYWIIGEKSILEEGGYDEFPYAACRSRKNSSETYGRGPADAAYKDLSVLNVMGETLLRAGQLAGDPAYNVPEEMKGKLKLKPRGYNYYEDQGRIITPINTGIEYPIGKDREDDRRAIIQKHFHTNLFRMLLDAQRQQTAYEVREKRLENAVLLGPQFGRIESEFLDPSFDRFFAIAMRNGRLPRPPDVLLELGGEIEIDYLGPLAQLQKRLHQTAGPLRALSLITPYAEIRPELMDIPNWDGITRMILEAEGMPPDMILTPDQVGEIREVKAQAQAAALEQEQRQQAADAVPKLNQPVAAGSPLAGMLGQSA